MWDQLYLFINRFGGGVVVVDSELVRLSIGSAFWSILYLFAISIKKSKLNRTIITSDDFIISASFIGLSTQFLQIFLILILGPEYTNKITSDNLLYFPFIVHFLKLISVSLISLYFLIFFKIKNQDDTNRYALTIISLSSVYFILSYISRYFDFYRICTSDFLFHVTAFLVISITFYYIHKIKSLMRNHAIWIMFIFGIAELLDLSDVIFFLQHTTLLTPIATILKIIAIPILIYFFIKVQTSDLEEQKNEFILKSIDRQTIIQGVAHELRSPLAGLVGMIDVFKTRMEDINKVDCDKTCIDCKRAEFINNFSTNGLDDVDEILIRISEMITNLTEFGKSSKDSEIKCYNLKPLLETAVRYAKFTEKSKLVTTRGIKIGTVTKANAHVSPSKFLQIIQNLIMNSIRAIQLKEEKIDPQIIVSLSTNKKISRHIISIEDNGIGMTKEQLERCTQKYFTTNVGVENAGLGLYFVDKYIKEFGGNIEIESEFKIGTIIKISLPIVPSEEVCEE